MNEGEVALLRQLISRGELIHPSTYPLILELLDERDALRSGGLMATIPSWDLARQQSKQQAVNLLEAKLAMMREIMVERIDEWYEAREKGTG